MFWNRIGRAHPTFYREGLNGEGSRTAPRFLREFPGVRLYRKEDEILLTAELPGVEAESLNLDIKEDLLMLSVRFGSEAEKEGETSRENPVGHFRREVRLPHRVDAQKAVAELKKGILTVRLPMLEEDKPKKISIRAA